LDYSVYDARRSGFGKIVFVINRESEGEFRSRIDESIGKQSEVEYVHQDLDNLPDGFQVPAGRAKPWGTAHAVLSCRDAVDGPFAVINADDFYGRTAYESLSEFLQHSKPKEAGYSFCMIGYQLKNTLTEHGYVSRGICSVDPNGNLSEVRERTHIQKFGEVIDSVASMNIWGFTTGLFNELDDRFERFLVESRANPTKAEFYLPELVNQLLGEGKAVVKVLPTSDRWFGVTYKDDLERVREAMKKKIDQGDYPVKLWG